MEFVIPLPRTVSALGVMPARAIAILVPLVALVVGMGFVMHPRTAVAVPVAGLRGRG
jgi:hypothetical protein